MHIMLNIFVQLIFGIALEHYFEAYRVAIIYIIGVFAGSITGAFIEPEKKVIGSSAGAYSIVVAFLVFFARVRLFSDKRILFYFFEI